MRNGPLPALLEHLRQWATPEANGLSDAQLLARFRTDKDRDVFATLIQRHGQMVWRVCRNVLRRDQDAEDAFQATFLVLAQNAASIRNASALAGWLHGTACRIARRARRDAATRQTHEHKRASMPSTQVRDESAWREILAILDDEVQRLPSRQRAVFVLCSLEGKSLAEAAALLGWKAGTVSVTLSRARQRLRRRLARRGVELSAVCAGLSLATDSAPAALVERTLHTALALAAGKRAAELVSASVASLVRQASQTLAVTKSRLIVFLLAASMIGAGVTGFAWHKPADSEQPLAEPPAPPPDEGKAERIVRERLDRFGDPLPPGAVTRIGTVRWWHGRKQDDHYQFPFAYTADGKSLVLCDDGKAVRILNATTGQVIRRIEPPLKPQERQSGFGDAITCFALAPDGKSLVTGCCWRPPLRIWDVATGKEIRQIPGDKHGTFNVAFSPDSKMIAANANSTDGIQLLDAATGKEIRRIIDKRAVNCSHGLVFSADGKTLITANGSDLHFWDVGSGRLLHSKESAKKGPAFTQPTVSPNGQRIAAWCSNDALYLWDASGKETIRRIKFGPMWPTYCFSPDGRILACNHSDGRTNATRLFAADTGMELRDWGEEVALEPLHMAFSPDGKILAQVREGVIVLYDTATGKRKETMPGLPSGVTTVKFLDDGKTLLTSGRAGCTGWWDERTGKQRAPFQEAPKDFPHSRSDLWKRAALSVDGRKAALADVRNVLHVWETATGATCCRIDATNDGSQKVVLSSDGKLVALGGFGKLRLWDTATGKLLRSFPVSPHSTEALAFSPDGRTLAYYFGSTTAIAEPPLVRLADVATGEERSRLAWPGDKDKPPMHLLFTADGKRLIASFDPGPNWAEEEAGWRIGWCVWDLASGRELRHVRGSAGPIVLSPDEKTLAAGENKTIILWELASGKERGRFRGHQERIESLAFSPDGRLLASGSLDHTACVWDVTGLCPDGQWNPQRVKPDELERLWMMLGSEDSALVYRAVWKLTAAGPDAVGLLAKRLRPTLPVEEKRLTQLLADLDSERFEVRDRASRELHQLGERTELALRKALAAKPSLEVAKRLRALLEQVESRTLSAEQLHTLRAVEVLEHIGSEEAQKVLRSLAAGAPGDRLTEEAKAAHKRLAASAKREP